jgi:hypothetical protein
MEIVNSNLVNITESISKIRQWHYKYGKIWQMPEPGQMKTVEMEGRQFALIQCYWLNFTVFMWTNKMLNTHGLSFLIDNF